MKISRGVTPVKGECQFGFRLTAPETSEQPHSGSKGRLRFGKPSSGLRVSCPAAQNGRASTFRSSLTQQQKAGALYRARTAHLWTTLRPPGLALNEKQIPRFVGNNGNASRKWNDWNELSCAQGRRATRLRYAPTDSMIIRQVYSERRGVAWGSKIWEGTEERD